MLSAATSAARADDVEFCFFMCKVKRAPVVDSYCSMTSRLMLGPEDGVAVRALPLPLQKRVNAADARYRCLCQGWKNPVCEK